MFCAVMLIYFFIFYFQGLPLARRGKWGELAVFTAILSLAIYYTAALMFPFPAPNPRRMIEVLTNPLAEYIFGSLK